MYVYPFDGDVLQKYMDACQQAQSTMCMYLFKEYQLLLYMKYYWYGVNHQTIN